VPKLSRTTKQPCDRSRSTSRRAASQNILDRGRRNSNAPELVSPTHTSHCAVRFAVILCSRAFLRASERFLGTSSPMPKNTSSGVCPANLHADIRLPIAAPIRTTEMADRDKRVNRLESALNKPVSGSVSTELNRQHPAESRAFPDPSCDPSGKSLHPVPGWRWNESEANSSLRSHP
jgi:hypothetical protein